VSVKICRGFAILAFFASTGCTFYTSCPTGSSNGNPSAGSSNGGSGNVGGSAGGSSASGNGGGIVGEVPTGEWQNITANLANQPAQCGNMAFIASKPNEDMLIAGVGLLSGEPIWWASRDGGGSWQALAQGKDSAFIENRPSYLLFDRDNADTFWVVGTYGAVGVYRTDDSGKTFKAVGDIKHNDFISVDFTDKKRNTMLVSAHEHGHTLFKSTNAGADWADIGDNIGDTINACDFPLVVDTQTFLFGCSQFGGGKGGIVRSTDAGDSWEPVGNFAEASGMPVVTSDGGIYWTTTSGLARSDTQGMDWEVVAQGLAAVPIVELPDNRIAAMTSYIVLSDDRGKTWKPVTSPVPFVANGFVYSAFQKAFVAWHGTCDSKVPRDAVMRYDFDYESE